MICSSVGGKVNEVVSRLMMIVMLLIVSLWLSVNRLLVYGVWCLWWLCVCSVRLLIVVMWLGLMLWCRLSRKNRVMLLVGRLV